VLGFVSVRLFTQDSPWQMVIKLEERVRLLLVSKRMTCVSLPGHASLLARLYTIGKPSPLDEKKMAIV